MNLLMCSPGIGGRTLNNLHYADDIVLIATTPTALQQLLIDKVAAVSRDYGLEISTRKTKVMVASAGRDHTFTCNGETVEQVESFRYLGAVITSTGDYSAHSSISGFAMPSVRTKRRQRSIK